MYKVTCNSPNPNPNPTLTPTLSNQERDEMLDEMRLLHVGTGASRFGAVQAA